MAGYFRNVAASPWLIIQEDQRLFAWPPAEDSVHTEMDTTGMINFWNNTIHLFTHEKISIYAWQDNSLKTVICSQKMSYNE